jgi:hypothetical protein
MIEGKILIATLLAMFVNMDRRNTRPKPFPIPGYEVVNRSFPLFARQRKSAEDDNWEAREEVEA